MMCEITFQFSKVTVNDEVTVTVYKVLVSYNNLFSLRLSICTEIAYTDFLSKGDVL